MKRKNRSSNCTNNNEKTTTEKTKDKYKSLCNRTKKVRKGCDILRLRTTMSLKRFQNNLFFYG